MNKIILLLFFIIVISSCGVHQRSAIKAEEEFVVELARPSSRGGLVEVALQGLFFGADYLAEKTAKSLTSSYSQSLSVNDYYNTDLGDIEKTYSEIRIKKYAAPRESQEEQRLKTIIQNDLQEMPKSRGNTAAMTMNDVIRLKDDHEDLLNFEAVIEIQSDPENPGVSRLSFNELRILFSRTKVYEDENLNARLSVSIEGHWRSKDNTPMQAILIEQEYDLKNLKYGTENQIINPILSPWYYDIPYLAEDAEMGKYGVVQVNVQLQEYEGGKSKYINQLPSILSDNKNAIIKNGSSTIQKIIGKD